MGHAVPTRTASCDRKQNGGFEIIIRKKRQGRKNEKAEKLCIEKCIDMFAQRKFKMEV